MGRNTSLPWLAAVALGLAILANTPAAASPANDYPEDRLQFKTVAAYRYGGNQPIDLYAVLVDDRGTPVEGATVTALISTSPSVRPGRLSLQDKGGGVYVACDAAYVDGPVGTDVIEFTGTLDRMHPAEAKASSERGNFCGEGEPQLHIASIQAAKLDGKDQPLSVLVELRDDGGNRVSGAKVRVRATDLREHTDMYLPQTGDGRYSSCRVGTFDTSGPGLIEVMVYASAEGYRPALEWSENKVGYLCANPAQQPPRSTARRQR